MTRPPGLKSLVFQNVLSFGDDPVVLDLRPLNVLIGPNGAGKSNVLEIVGLLQGAPRDLTAAVRDGGGVAEWLWKGAPELPVATVEAVLENEQARMPLRYRLRFTASGLGPRFEVVDERIETERPYPGKDRPYLYFGYENGRPYINVGGSETGRQLRREDVHPQQSILSQRKDPDLYPEMTYVGQQFDSMRLYRDWFFGRSAKPRRPQSADLPNDFLREDADNLGLILSKIRRDVRRRRQLVEQLRAFYEDAEDIDVTVESGTVQIFLLENKFTISANRLSDGTLRWLALLSILLDPSPPPVVCIEEPELGLHPDALPVLGSLLVEASERMQLIVTTHSVALVDSVGDDPERVVVCEKHDGVSNLRRLDADELSPWLEEFTVGQLWRKNEIGGNRY